ncbi:enoyl-CoA hydratase/isomerase family protein [Massilia cavernae]|uniref:Enoyl-CoA hydratase/isomerase family protein n=1 Tax=Massilia cavernae TaxID=2320864 RepID=A0A418X751_9BURK|nr:enoyl-CoA hydratase/isomerase family protein [Massilia cavernae]RJG08280.1 enoyl-CoA hydratase/isomerase family protein [Massilia cavernae]
MADQELITEIDGPIARITFNRPQARNALTAGMVVAMREFLKQIETDPSVRCVVMTGAGDHFMAGGDVAGFAQALDAAPGERRRDFEERARSAMSLFAAMERLPQPIIAKVRGAVAGASVGWVAASDFVLVSDTALFVVAHILLGTSPDGAVTWHLPRAIGLRKAKEMALLGDRLSAAEAVAFGRQNRTSSADAELDAETEEASAAPGERRASPFARTKMLAQPGVRQSDPRADAKTEAGSRRRVRRDRRFRWRRERGRR